MPGMVLYLLLMLETDQWIEKKLLSKWATKVWSLIFLHSQRSSFLCRLLDKEAIAFGLVKKVARLVFRAISCNVEPFQRTGREEEAFKLQFLHNFGHYPAPFLSLSWAVTSRLQTDTLSHTHITMALPKTNTQKCISHRLPPNPHG